MCNISVNLTISIYLWRRLVRTFRPELMSQDWRDHQNHRTRAWFWFCWLSDQHSPVFATIPPVCSGPQAILGNQHIVIGKQHWPGNLLLNVQRKNVHYYQEDVRAKSWPLCKPTATLKLAIVPTVDRTWVRYRLYIARINSTYLRGTPFFLKVHHKTFRGTRSYDFLRFNEDHVRVCMCTSVCLT